MNYIQREIFHCATMECLHGSIFQFDQINKERLLALGYLRKNGTGFGLTSKGIELAIPLLIKYGVLWKRVTSRSSMIIGCNELSALNGMSQYYVSPAGLKDSACMSIPLVRIEAKKTWRLNRKYIFPTGVVASVEKWLEIPASQQWEVLDAYISVARNKKIKCFSEINRKIIKIYSQSIL